MEKGHGNDKYRGAGGGRGCKNGKRSSEWTSLILLASQYL